MKLVITSVGLIFTAFSLYMVWTYQWNGFVQYALPFLLIVAPALALLVVLDRA